MTTGLVVGKVQVILPRFSGLSQDGVDNVFHFEMNDATDYDATEYTAITDRLITFYNTNPGAPASFAIASCFPVCISRTSNAAKMYVYAKGDVDPDTPFGSPKFTRSWTVGAIQAGATGLTAESCAVLSFHGDLTDVPETAPNPTPPPAIIRPAASRRGRIYIGPMNTNPVQENSGSANEVIVSSAGLNCFAGAASDLLAANTTDWVWSIYSHREGLMHEVTGGFVDNAFDTQRRRGNAATSRTTWA